MKLGVSTTEIMQTEMGKDFIEARQKAESLEQHYKENEIGEQEVIAWNSYKLKNRKNPYAEAIEKAFNKMRKNAMKADFSWKVSSEKYMDMYKELLEK